MARGPSASPRADDPDDATLHDLLVIGGGINGAGIARDAAGRGLSVLLVEQDDLASATSSVEHQAHPRRTALPRALRVPPGRRGAGRARGAAARIAPHLIEPLAFVLPHEPHLRPAWMIRIGLFLYDHLGGRETLPKSFGVRLAGTPLGRGPEAALHARASSTPMRASTMRGSSWPTRSMRRRAAPTSACAPAS